MEGQRADAGVSQQDRLAAVAGQPDDRQHAAAGQFDDFDATVALKVENTTQVSNVNGQVFAELRPDTRIDDATLGNVKDKVDKPGGSRTSPTFRQPTSGSLLLLQRYGLGLRARNSAPRQEPPLRRN